MEARARLPHRAVRLRTWKETAYALVALPLGVAWFTIFLTLPTTSGSLLVFVVGLPLLAATLWLARVASRAQREVAGGLLGAAIPGPPSVQAEGRPFQRFLQPLADLSTWRALVYLLIFAFPVGLVLFVAAVVLWSVALAAVTAPAWYFTIPDENRGDVFGTVIDAPWEWPVLLAGGLVLVFLTPPGSSAL